MRSLSHRGVSLVLAASAAALACGCAIGAQRFGRVIDADRIAQVTPGTSTKQDVLDLFGPPTTYSHTRGVRQATAPAPPETGQGETPSEPGPPPEAPEEAPPPGGDGAAAESVFTYEYREENERFFTAILFTWYRREVIADTLVVFFDSKDVVKYLAFTKQTEAQPGGTEEEVQ